jgi:hypothetical protein
LVGVLDPGEQMAAQTAPEEASGCGTGSIRFLKVHAKRPSLAG